MEKVQSKKKQRIAVIVTMITLLIAVLCLGGVTFAKYITRSSDISKTATVAKWGYVINVNANNMFSSDYGEGSEGYATAVQADNAVSVKADPASAEASTRNMLVAPGTKGEMTFSIKGSAEVLSQIKINFGETYSDVVLKYTKTGVDGTQTYNPIKWSLVQKSGETTTTLVEQKTLAECATEFEKLQSLVVDAGTSVNYEYTLSWSWAYHVDDDTDVLDTILSNVVYNSGIEEAANKVAIQDGYTVDEINTKTSISFTLNVSVEQIQNKPAVTD